MNSDTAKLPSRIKALLKNHIPQSASRSPDWSEETLELQPLLSDGSSRRFFRIFWHDAPFCIAVCPGSNDEAGRSESRAAAALGSHLYRKGVPVPRVIAFAQDSGLVLFEDLGDVRLHDYLRTNPGAAKKHYPQIVRALARMQVHGAEGFDPGWCFDTPAYDQQVMVERESGYFMRAFWRDTLFEEAVPGLEEEFVRLAETAAAFYKPLFLHRDFQSRNIMIRDDQIKIIDFQAGRLGPPAYDLASLLIDPYAALSDREQKDILDRYIDELQALGGPDAGHIRESYPYLAVQRNLQIIGAFAFLSSKKKKAFFLPFILPSLVSLHNRLVDPLFDGFPFIRRTVSEALLKYRSHMKG